MAQKDTRFTIPERRHVQQVIFPSLEQAQKAYGKIKSGTSFERILEETKTSLEASTLGTALAKSDIVDPKIAEVAFSLSQGGVSLPVDGTFGPALVRVLKISPSEVKPYEAVERALREEISTKRGAALLQDRITTIEDQLASAKSLESIGTDLNVASITLETDIAGRNLKGLLIESMPSLPEILPAMFRAHVNFDEEPVRLQNGGFVWFTVTHISPPRDRALEEVHSMVLKAWETEERSKRLEALAQKLLVRWQKGESAEVLATSLKTPLEIRKVTRANEIEGKVPAQLVRSAFQSSVGHRDLVPVDVDDSESRALFFIKDTSVPHSGAPLAEEEHFAEVFPQEFLFDYINSLRVKMDVRLHPKSLTPQEMSFVEKVPFLSASLPNKPS
jgi:peptidyl-prolyl cis-trans isomerase D